MRIQTCFSVVRGRRLCKYCISDFGMGTGNTTLLEHMWKQHETNAVRLGLRESWTRTTKRKADADLRGAHQPSSSTSSRVSWTHSSAHELCTLAMALLSVTASEAAVERSFSRQGIIHSKLRNRLLDDSVQMQMFFSFNTRALEQPNRHHSASVAELEEEEEETNKAAALLNGAQYYDDDEIVAVASEDEQKAGHDEESESEEEDEQAAVAAEELELDDEEEEDEEEEEKEMEQEPEVGTEAQNLEEFVKKYVADNNLVRGFRLRDWQRSALQSVLLETKIKTQEVDVILALRKYVGDRALVQDEKMEEN